jgi:hypothetical protein
VRVLIPIALLVAYGQTPTHDPSAAVTDPSAPTVADLQRRGLTQVGYEPAGGPDCGPNCVVDAMSAIYMGKETRRLPPARQFVCPVSSGDTETWKCRPWGATNG